MKKRLFLGGLTLSLVVLFGVARAALLNVNLKPSVILYVTAGAASTQYNSVSQIFSVTATPSQIQFSPTEGALTVFTPRALTIRIQVDNTGALVGGVAGPDLVVSGKVTRVVGTTTNVYSGELLTGEIQPNGFGFFDSGGTVDNYDFRFTPTGGQLQQFYQCDHVAVTLSSAGSTFVGSFATNFSGQAKGNVGLEDLIPPKVTCPFGDNANTTNVECNAGSGGLRGAFVSFPNPVGTDNCDTNITFVYSPPSGSFFPLDPGLPAFTNYVVTLTATDASGNQDACTFTVVIQDTLPPEFNDNSSPVMGDCSENPFVLTNDIGQCYATFTFTKPTAVNLCCPAVHTVTASAVDENGAVIPVTDNGDGTVTGLFPVTCVGTNILTLVAADDHGNSAQHECGVLVVDGELPVITCPSNQTVECTGGPVFYQEPTASDNCPYVTVSCVPTNGSLMGIGTHSILCTAADCGGNTNQCTFDVTVQDTTPPTMTCPADGTVVCGQSTAPGSTGIATATDTCDAGPTVTFTDAVSGGCPQTITRTWKATDASGNSATCVQRITINDTTPPTLTAVPTGSNLGCNPATLPTDASVKALATATDDCGTPTINVSHVDANNGCAVTRTFTVTATDACGNSSPAQTVVYTWTADTTPPTLTAVPTGSNLGCNPASLPTDASVKALASATDACSTPTINVSHVDANNGCAVTRTFTVTATDGCGNNSAAQTVVYTWTADTTAPTITCPAPVTVQCPSNVPAPDVTSVTASDNCGAVTVSFVSDVVTNQTCANRYTILRTYKAVDACGNSAACTQTITVNDTTKPTISCPANVTVGLSSFCTNVVPATDPTIVAFLHGVTATDNCGGSATVTNNAPSSFPVGTNTVTFTATDSCGNTTTCQAKVIVATQSAACHPIQTEFENHRCYFDKYALTSQHGFFHGRVTFTGGDMASDFRVVPGHTAKGTLKVTIGGKVVYCNDHITYTVSDCDDPTDNREKWQYNGGPNELVEFRWLETQQFDATRDPNVPRSAATGYKNVGMLSSQFIHTDETRYRFYFNQATLPIEIRINGIKLLSVNASGQVSTAYPYWKNGKMVDVLFPDRLNPGDVMVYDTDSNSSNGVIYTQSVSADGNCRDEYFNAGGKFFIKVPVAGLSHTQSSRGSKVEFTIGQAGVTLVGCGQDVIDDNICVPIGHNWKFHDGDEDDCERDVEADD